MRVETIGEMNPMQKDKNCYACIHRQKVPGSVHSSCRHPAAGGEKIVQMVKVYQPPASTATLAVKLNEYGVRTGYAFWPENFDPIWVDECGSFEQSKGAS